MALFESEELRALREENAYLKGELQTWQEMGPHLYLAEELKDELIQDLGSSAIASMTAPEIGKSAYEKVRERKRAEARDELVIGYERTHRQALYERLIEEVRAEEGDSLMEAAFEKIETDPHLAKELRDSAVKELTARAKDVVSGHITEQQQVVVEAETDRQLKLDRFDVRFVMEGMVDLNDPELLEVLKPHDKLVVMFEKHPQGRAGIEFEWADDINQAEGWVYGRAIAESPRQRRDQYGYSRYDEARGVTVNDKKLPKDRFVTLGTELPDLTNGTTGIKRDVLCAKNPLVVSWMDTEGQQQDHVLKEAIRSSHYEVNAGTARICATDFQTRDIEFLSAPDK